MRVFILIRILFFTLIATAISLFLFHSKFCVNFRPHQLEKIHSNCEQHLKSAISFENAKSRVRRTPRSINVLVRSKEIGEVEHLLNSDSNFEEPGNYTTLEPEDNSTTTSDFSNETTIVYTTPQEANLTSDTSEASTSAPKREILSKSRYLSSSDWHHIEFEGQKLRIQTRSCFDYDFKYILVTDSSYISQILSPLRLLFIVIITSLLLSLLDIALKYILKTGSLIQTLVHSTIQFLLWSFNLIYIELFRRNWQKSWESHSNLQFSPVYPGQWLLFEVVAFLIVMLIIFDTIAFNYSNYRLRFENSQGVYRIIEREEEEERKRRGQIGQNEEDEEYLNASVYPRVI
ncbi:unnamed protein product [Caenorhabditis angaria]|uniref:Uncharacterized protein n=1 Tax=Caenorhabditis angaria TaxID=860376 RepID=A0A9P1IF15_9PELO|nr:unnamed protein product [Caenorhabditis angaria]